MVSMNWYRKYSPDNEGKSVVAERFNRTLKSKIYKCATSISKTVYINKLDEIVNECNSTHHSTIRMIPVNVKSSTHIDFNVENNGKDPKFDFGDCVEMSRYKIFFANDYTSNWSEEVFVIIKVENALMDTCNRTPLWKRNC